MVTIILKTRRGVERERVSFEGNDRFLRRSDPSFLHLSQLGEYSYMVLDADDMAGFIGELHRIRSERRDPAEVGHIDEIVRLAQLCSADDGLLFLAPVIVPRGRTAM